LVRPDPIGSFGVSGLRFEASLRIFFWNIEGSMEGSWCPGRADRRLGSPDLELEADILEGNPPRA